MLDTLSELTPEELEFIKKYGMKPPKRPVVEAPQDATMLAQNSTVIGKTIDENNTFDAILKSAGIEPAPPSVSNNNGSVEQQRQPASSYVPVPEETKKKTRKSRAMTDEQKAAKKEKKELAKQQKIADDRAWMQESLKDNDISNDPVMMHMDDDFYETFMPGLIEDDADVEKSFDTKLTPDEEVSFQAWKRKYAPNDSGEDYDLRGAYKAGLTPDAQTGHWPDTFKKPNHPTFSDQSQYAKDAPDKAGHWDGDTYVPPKGHEPSAFDTFLDWIVPDENPSRVVDENGLTAQNKQYRRDMGNVAAGAMAMPGETLYGMTGFALSGAEKTADYVNRKMGYSGQTITDLVTGKPAKGFDFGSDYYFDKAAGVTKASEYVSGSGEIENTTDNFFRNLGGAVPYSGAPLVAITDTVVGTIIGDVSYDLSDPKYASVFDMNNRQPSSTTPEVASHAEIGADDGAEETSSVYARWGIAPWMIMGGIAAYGGYRGVRALIKPSRPLNVDTSKSITRAQPNVESATTAGEAFRSQQQDQTYILKSQYGRGMANPNDPAIVAFTDDVDTLTHVAGAQAADYSIRTGRILAGNKWIEGPSPYNLIQAHSKLTPEQQQLFNVGMTSGDILDDLNLGHLPRIKQMTVAEAKANLAAMRKDPVLKQLEGEYRKVMQNMLDFSEEVGFVDKNYKQALNKDRSMFVPSMSADDVDAPLWERLGRALVRGPDDDSNMEKMIPKLKKRDDEAAILNRVPPMDAMAAYMSFFIPYGNANRLRMQFLENALASPNADIRGSVRKLKQGASDYDPEKIVTYYKDGERIRVEVADPALIHALKFSPASAKYPLFNAWRQTKQMFTTGIMAPLFASTALLREGVLASVQRPVGRQMGYIDKGLQYVSGGRIGFRGDLTSIAAGVFNIPRDLVPRAMLAFSDEIHSSLMAGNSTFWNGIDKLAGKGTSLAMADRMRNAYITSMRGMLDSYGGYNVGMTADSIAKSKKVLDVASQAWTAKFGESSLGAWKSYRAAIESMNNAARLAFWSQNWKPTMDIRQQKRLAVDTRELSGNLTLRGSGPLKAELRKPQGFPEKARQGFTQLFNRAFPQTALTETSLYYNPMVQGLSRFAKSFHGDATGTAVGLMNALTVPAVAGVVVAAHLDSDDVQGYMDYMFNRRPEWMKASSMYFPIPGLPPEQGLEIPISPDMGVIAYMQQSMMDQLFSQIDVNPTVQKMGSRAKFLSPQDMIRRKPMDEAAKQMWNAVGNVIGISVPVPIAVGGALMGKKFFSEGPLYGAPQDIQLDDVTGGGELTGLAEPDDYTGAFARQALVELFGTGGNMGLQMFDAGARGYDTGENLPDSVKRALQAVEEQTKYEGMKRLRFLKPVTQFHIEYASRESDVKYAKQQAADNLAEVISAQIIKAGEEVRSKPAKGVPGVITDAGMREMNNFAVQSANTLQPIKNQKFLQVAPLIYDTVRKNDAGIQDIIGVLATLKKQQKDMRAINAGNLDDFNASMKKRGRKPFKGLKDVQHAINSLEMVRRELNIQYIKIITDMEHQMGIKVEDIDPYKEDAAPTVPQQQPMQGRYGTRQ